MFNKLNLIRVPLRLGFDVFETKTISPDKEDMIIKTLQSYKYLLEVYKVSFYKACATSAMRDASNAKEILARVLGETGIKIEVLTGDEEASVIYENHIAENLNPNRSYLYIDVGGGSTEITLFSNNEMAFKQSFDIGTIRLLKNQVQESHWLKMKEFIKDKTRFQRELVAIGTGGNINKVFSLSKKKDGKPLHIELLKDYFKEFSNFNVKDRMKAYNLREDRADVIVPALQIYVNVMRWADTDEIYVPKIGLADGLVQHLYARLKEKSK